MCKGPVKPSMYMYRTCMHKTSTDCLRKLPPPPISSAAQALSSYRVSDVRKEAADGTCVHVDCYQVLKQLGCHVVGWEIPPCRYPEPESSQELFMLVLRSFIADNLEPSTSFFFRVFESYSVFFF